jgi:hypothetical protein
LPRERRLTSRLRPLSYRHTTRALPGLPPYCYMRTPLLPCSLVCERTCTQALWLTGNFGTQRNNRSVSKPRRLKPNTTVRLDYQHRRAPFINTHVTILLLEEKGLEVQPTVFSKFVAPFQQPGRQDKHAKSWDCDA